MYQLTMNRGFPLPLHQLFEAWKNPELLQKWFAPGDLQVAETTIDFKVGGAYRIVMKNPQGQVMAVGGTYLEIIEEQRLVFSWKWEASPNTTKVEIDFEAVNGHSSQLTLVHSEFLTDPEQSHHHQGWTSMMEKLRQGFVT